MADSFETMATALTTEEAKDLLVRYFRLCSEGPWEWTEENQQEVGSIIDSIVYRMQLHERDIQLLEERLDDLEERLDNMNEALENLYFGGRKGK